jgi:16S rRNA (guanine527-N7)-methyltransferase
MRNILIQGAVEYGLKLTESDIGAFSLYYRLLEEKNRVINLTTITGENEVAELHFLDSLALMPLGSFAGKTVIDVGSGAGFPGFPMKIVERSMRLTSLDAQQKRVGFLEELRDALTLTGVDCVHMRAEEAARSPRFRDAFDFAVSRAVARLNILSELCLPFVRVGGAFIAMKSTDSDEEIKEAENAFGALGAVLEKVSDYRIPGTDVTHRAVVIRKITPTPDEYPRRFAKIEKKPL